MGGDVRRCELDAPCKGAKVVEAVILAWCVLSLLFALAFALPCRDVGGEGGVDLGGHDLSDSHSIHLVAWQCTAAGEGGGRRLASAARAANSSAPYSDMATLLMQPQEAAIKQLCGGKKKGSAGTQPVRE